MIKVKQLLFVIYHDEDFDEGLFYAADLAKTMGDSIGILMVCKEDSEMAQGERSGGAKETADLLVKGSRRRREAIEGRLSLIKETCRKAGVSVEVSTVSADIVPAVRKILSQKARIDMVLLSPGITNDAEMNKTLKRLLKSASRKIVTMAKQADSA